MPMKRQKDGDQQQQQQREEPAELATVFIEIINVAQTRELCK
jgi:hypothetical protein